MAGYIAIYTQIVCNHSKGMSYYEFADPRFCVLVEEVKQAYDIDMIGRRAEWCEKAIGYFPTSGYTVRSNKSAASAMVFDKEEDALLFRMKWC